MRMLFSFRGRITRTEHGANYLEGMAMVAAPSATTGCAPSA